MSTVSTRALEDHLSLYLERAETGEAIVVERDGKAVAALVPLSYLYRMDQQAVLADLESRGLMSLPRGGSRAHFERPTVPNRGKLASEMVLEDRR
jgi:antitoxin (DNA-binding transcriptional repressor) of toxin-antitoxin stability system